MSPTAMRGDISEKVLASKGIACKVISRRHEASVEEFVDSINSRRDLLNKSQGLVEVGIYSSIPPPLGHAIALEINHDLHMYSIIDVNYGVYQFSSYEELRQGLGMFLEQKYPDTGYDSFSANVFYPK